MSQKKVDQYKKEKANRAQIMKKEKLVRRFETAAVIIILAGLLGWFSTAVFMNAKSNADANAEAKVTELNVTEVDDYINNLTVVDSEAE